MSGAEFLQYIPSVEKLCQVDCLQVCNIDSTNMTPSHWLAIAQAVETHYETYDGFVILPWDGYLGLYCRSPELPHSGQPQAHCPHRQPEAHSHGHHRLQDQPAGQSYCGL